MTEILSQLSIWHWFAFGLVLFGIEMMTGTFDLLMISIAAFATGIFTYFAPAGLGGWETQMIIFGIASIALIIFGRTVLSGMRSVVDEHPTLNKRMNSLIGKRGMVTSDFEAGQGRVKIGDTEWLAESVDGSNFEDGAAIVVEDAESTMVRVRPA